MSGMTPWAARHDEISLAVGGSDPADAPECEHTEMHPEASYLSATDGAAAIRRLFELHSEHQVQLCWTQAH